jgi:hypothetical protein
MSDEAIESALVHAGLNAGFLTLADAVRAGLTESQIRTQDRRGTWDRVVPGLRRVGGSDASDAWRDRVRASVLRAGTDAVAAGHTAGRLLGIAGTPATGPIWLAVPRGRHPDNRPGVRVMRTIVTPQEIDAIDNIPTTAALRTVLDSARYGDGLAAVCLVESAVRQELVSIGSVREAVAAIRGQRGSVRAATALQRIDLLSESPLETKARLLLLDAGLPYPELQHPPAPGDPRRIDLAYLAPSGSAYVGLAIEIDGRESHAREDAFDSDPRRQIAIEEAGWLVRRFTHKHLQDPAYVVRTVQKALDRIGFRTN